MLFPALHKKAMSTEIISSLVLTEHGPYLEVKWVSHLKQTHPCRILLEVEDVKQGRVLPGCRQAQQLPLSTDRSFSDCIRATYLGDFGQEYSYDLDFCNLCSVHLSG